MSHPEDTLQGYREAMTRLTPANPRQEADILASLAAFDALQAETRAKAKAQPGWLARLLRPRALGLGGLVLASGLAAVVLFPPQAPHPDFGPGIGAGPAAVTERTPPELRLALPRTALPDAPVSPGPAPEVETGREAVLLDAFSHELPQYFRLPWARDQVLALTATGDVAASGQILAQAGGRSLSIGQPPAEMLGARGADESYHRFAVGLAGLLQLQAGGDLGPDWDRARLLTELRQAAAGHPAREAALAAVSDQP